MTLTLELSPEKEAFARARADDCGCTVEEWLLGLADPFSPSPTSMVHLQRADPDKWASAFDAWVKSHDPKGPVLSDESIGRESIYVDRL